MQISESNAEVSYWIILLMSHPKWISVCGYGTRLGWHSYREYRPELAGLCLKSWSSFARIWLYFCTSAVATWHWIGLDSSRIRIRAASHVGCQLLKQIAAEYWTLDVILLIPAASMTIRELWRKWLYIRLSASPIISSSARFMIIYLGKASAHQWPGASERRGTYH
jgi:hypothetical protein